ncbi:lipopolysaccharide biosynthesis protein [Pseudarthrobacter sp. NIBRBAC000502771]|uniref:lipopolysaccharide biosynthesis protein n=1 Tax=Pseudarthrobacter sp. NIBRBAC000502771 TaxID=2590774 RepID=UPI00113089B9|nr:oligosaccharide flippase family protein [Pseudarthrobacter sp. NIBRBAC000502771]QDG62555.1 hypothetical protein NIBR502771_09625 [Pseudarthrobacter sp. NIBRBAC000502771]
MKTSFLSQSLLYATATIAPVLVNFAITPVITRLLGAEAYGVIGIGISLFQFGIVIFTLGLAASITRQAIIEDSGRPGAVATVIQGAASSVVLFLLCAALLPHWGRLILPGAGDGVLLYPLASCFGLALLQNSQSFLRAEQRAGTFVALGISASLTGPLFGVGIVLAFGPGPALYLAGLACGHVTVGIIAMLVCLKIQKPMFAKGQFLSNLRVGLPTVPHQIAVSFMTLTVVSASSHLVGLDAAGGLQLALLIGSAPMLLLGALNNAWAPYVYRARPEERGEILAGSYRSVMLLTAAMVCGFAVLAPIVVPFVAGPMAQSAPVLQASLIAALGTPFMTSYLANIHMVFISGRTGALAITTPISAVVSLSLVFVPVLFGVPGDIRLFSLAIPIFQLSQLVSSIVLRRKRVDIVLPALGVLPEFFTVSAVLTTSFLFAHAPVVYGTLSAIIVLILILARRNLIMNYFESWRSASVV